MVHLDLANTAAPQHTGTPRPAWKPARTAGAETSTSPAPVRAGFVVSRAVGGAVVRNQVRRRLRHLVRERLAALPAGATLVVRALPGAADTPYVRLGADLDAAIAAALARRSARRAQ